MAEIITNPNWVQIDGVRIQKGSRDLIPLSNGVRLKSWGNNDSIDINVANTTIDGVDVTTASELLSFFDSQGFRNGGGGTGEGVPNGTELDILTWDESGNPIAGRITAWQLTDIAGRPPFAFGVLAGASLQNDNPLLLFTEVVSTAKTSTIPMYRNESRLSVGDGLANDDAINLGQLNQRIPLPPASGSAVLRSVNGVITWVLE